MYESIFESDLLLYYQRKMLIHIENHKVQDLLLASVEHVLSTMKRCLSKQTDAIEKEENILTKIDEDVVDLRKTIQTYNSNKIMNSNIDGLF